MAESLCGLMLFYEEFVPRFFPLAGGKPRGRRSAQMIAKDYNLPVIRVKKITYIDPAMAAEHLRRLATQQRETPRRGRPKLKPAEGMPAAVAE